MIRTQKLTQEEWEEIEVDLTDFEQRVCSLMLKAGCLYDVKDTVGEKKLKLEVGHKLPASPPHISCFIF